MHNLFNTIQELVINSKECRRRTTSIKTISTDTDNKISTCSLEIKSIDIEKPMSRVNDINMFFALDLSLYLLFHFIIKMNN